MSALSAADRTKLARVLGLLGSNHQGERDAAGLAADRIVRGAGLSWEDLLQSAPPVYRVSPPQERRTGELAARVDARFCLRHFERLTSWEQGFVSSVATRSTVSEKQAGILRQAADRLRARGFT